MGRIVYETEAGEALFEEKEDGSLLLARWPRKRLPAEVPETLGGKTVTEIGPAAFSDPYIPGELFEREFRSPYSFNMLALKLGGQAIRDAEDEGGPAAILLPRTIVKIGSYAFWHCANLAELTIPDGVRELPAGVFGECSRLKRLTLPAELETLGFFPAKTDMAMPDIGSLYCCHSLKRLTLPAKLRRIGAYCFNSAGLVHLTAEDADACGGREPQEWSREITVAENAFDHAAALLWMERTDTAGNIIYRIGLPAARDKILKADRKFGALSHAPADFFNRGVRCFDELARTAFRIDFSARMALARLRYDGFLSDEDRSWYVKLLVDYYGQAPQFMPVSEDPFTELLDVLEASGRMRAEDVSAIARTAGELRLPGSLIDRIIELRATGYGGMTGFEDLEL